MAQLASNSAPRYRRERRGVKYHCRLPQRTNAMQLRLGTAGYAYPAWVGGFYPRGTTQHDMLPYYATQFAAVEINSSFYRPPTREQVGKMARRLPGGRVAKLPRRTPAGFGFTFKVPKSVSHELSGDDLQPFKFAADHMA